MRTFDKTVLGCINIYVDYGVYSKAGGLDFCLSFCPAPHFVELLHFPLRPSCPAPDEFHRRDEYEIALREGYCEVCGDERHVSWAQWLWFKIVWPLWRDYHSPRVRLMEWWWGRTYKD